MSVDVGELFRGTLFAVQGAVSRIDGVFPPRAGLNCAALDTMWWRLPYKSAQS